MVQGTLLCVYKEGGVCGAGVAIWWIKGQGAGTLGFYSCDHTSFLLALGQVS